MYRIPFGKTQLSQLRQRVPSSGGKKQTIQVSEHPHLSSQTM